MINWYSRITQDIGNIPDCITWYETQLDEARVECYLKGNLEKAAAMMPGVVEKRFAQLQEIEGIRIRRTGFLWKSDNDIRNSQ